MAYIFQVFMPLQADEFGQNVAVLSIDLTVQLHKPKTFYLPVHNPYHLANKPSMLQLSKDGATGTYGSQSYMSGKALIAE